MDLPTFRAHHPEFNNVGDTVVQAELNAALLELDAVVWGAKLDQGQRFLTAHKLALSPYGTGTRLQLKDGSTTYWGHYQALVYQVARGGVRVC